MSRTKSRPVHRRRGERGLTLIEMMIAVLLVAALMTGMLMVMRTGMITYEKLNHRLEANRRAMGLQLTLQHQIAGMIPVMAGCAGPKGVLAGSESMMHFVSSDSLAEGARGYPRVVDFRVAPDPDGGVRLMMTETLYNGILPTTPCGGAAEAPLPDPAKGSGSAGSSGALPPGTPQAIQMAGKLAYLRFAYQDVLPDTPLGGPWLTAWSKPILPVAVRMEMAPLHPESNELPSLTLSVPLRLTRQLGMVYVDQ